MRELRGYLLFTGEYISSTVLKTLDFSRDELYLILTDNNMVYFIFYPYATHGRFSKEETIRVFIMQHSNYLPSKGV